ncbi:hypothetical protein [Gulosibacter molinativorax]|uniref:Uncharacterized protein n=1 Tax=Gulosibacter molinativorax TaxID=256821 RepID=A0ABT7C4J0_9MICO|nr:hypothetical protein [Gulosibacter molinativorax]MDJ1370127.1 hypothetical protein [Gulosibacter molinativorax]
MGVQVPLRARNERCCNPGLKKQVLGYSIALLVGGRACFGPGEGLLLRGLVEDRGEGSCGVGGEGVALVQVDAGEEGLVREALVVLVAALVDLGEVACEIESSVDEGAGSLVVVVVLGDLRLDPVELGAEPGLELLQLVQ